MFVSDFEQHLVGDVQAVINEAKKTLQTDKLPVFVYGESMGGNISLRLLLNGQASKSFAGGVLVAPMTQIGEDVKPPAWQVCFIYIQFWGGLIDELLNIFIFFCFFKKNG